MLKIDQYAYINKLAGVHPAEKMGFALVTMAICLTFASPLTSFLIILIMATATVLIAGVPILFYFKLMLVPASFLLVSILAVVFVFVKGDYSLLWGLRVGGYLVGVTVHSLHTAGELVLRSLGAVSCLYFLSLTTPMVEILAVLRKMRVPPLLVELMALVYRFIFVLLETADKIYVSQASRWGYANVKTTYHSLRQLITNLFSKTCQSSRMLYAALSARCYTGEINVLEKSYLLSAKNITLIIITELSLILLGILSENLFLLPLGW